MFVFKEGTGIPKDDLETERRFRLLQNGGLYKG
jgi:hypothetical protein